MATVASLICWGGSTGKAVASINTANDQLTITNHGLRDGGGVQFDSWTTAPTVVGGVALNTTYYAKYISQNAFELYYDSGLTSKLDFTAAGSALYLKSAYLKGLPDTSRWGTLIYDGIGAWNSGRAGASEFDVEIAEIGEAFTEFSSADLVITVPSAQNRIETRINGARTAGFHYGKIPAALAGLTPSDGYIFWGTASTTSIMRITRVRDTIDGIIGVWGGSTARNIFDVGAMGTLLHSIATCSAGNFGTGIYARNAFATIIGNVCYRLSAGITSGTSQSGIFWGNNTIANVSTSISGVNANTTVGTYYNNISTVAWPAQPTNIVASGNSGPTGSAAWVTGSGTSYTVDTTDFADYANRDLKPLNGASPQVDTGILYYGYPDRDIRNLERPAYNNGGSEAIDIGAYEHDPGFGPHPASCALTLTNVVPGSSVLIVSQDGGTVHYNGTSAGSTFNQTITLYGDSRDQWRIRVRKGTTAAYYQPWETLLTATAAGASIYVAQVPDE
ncbi:MAG TPA: hypothetical protein PLR85_11360 [Nitrospira sp.]|nr:hypothetical protein [Nitrospira sp.]HNC78531.1 hypothetical protein [Rhodocyclaceae bacterium]HNG53971.1 hypothetical protein [Nitrospira sp.]